MADRYTYLPLVGIFLILVWGAGEIVRRWRATAVPFCFLGIGALIACALTTKTQLRYWQNSETLYKRAIAVNGNNYIAHYNLGYYLFQCGRLDEAIENYRRALLSNTNYFDAHYGLANALLKSGRTDEAIEHYQCAAQLKPAAAKTYNNLGLALAMKGQSDEAVANFHKALRLRPDFAEAWCNLGGVFMVQKQYDEAIVSYEAALRVEANRPQTHFSLAQAFFSRGGGMTRHCNSRTFYPFRRIIPRFIWNWARCWRGLANPRKPPLNFVKRCGSRAISRRLNAR